MVIHEQKSWLLRRAWHISFEGSKVAKKYFCPHPSISHPLLLVDHHPRALPEVIPSKDKVQGNKAPHHVESSGYCD